MLDWLKDWAAAISGLSTTVLVVITFVYVRYTGKSLGELRAQREELERQCQEAMQQRLDAARLVVVGIWTYSVGGSGNDQYHCSLRLENCGAGTAVRLLVRIWPEDSPDSVQEKRVPSLGPGQIREVLRLSDISKDVFHSKRYVCSLECEDVYRHAVKSPVTRVCQEEFLEIAQ